MKKEALLIPLQSFQALLLLVALALKGMLPIMGLAAMDLAHHKAAAMAAAVATVNVPQVLLVAAMDLAHLKVVAMVAGVATASALQALPVVVMALAHLKAADMANVLQCVPDSGHLVAVVLVEGRVALLPDVDQWELAPVAHRVNP